MVSFGLVEIALLVLAAGLLLFWLVRPSRRRDLDRLSELEEFETLEPGREDDERQP